MASADQIKALLRSHLEGNESQFLSVAMQVAAYEARKGHGKLAEELRAMIDEAKARQSPLRAPDRAPTPIGKPRGELSSLVAASTPTQRLSSMVVAQDVHERLARIIREQRHFARIREHGLSPRRKLLLVGPPGTGKTLTASVVAGELGLPLFQVRLDGLISKFMGETAAKLRLIFDAIASSRAVYFFDEFDAIASQRAGASVTTSARFAECSTASFSSLSRTNQTASSLPRPTIPKFWTTQYFGASMMLSSTNFPARRRSLKRSSPD